jgi:hypothetical protein
MKKDLNIWIESDVFLGHLIYVVKQEVVSFVAGVDFVGE